MSLRWWAHGSENMFNGGGDLRAEPGPTWKDPLSACFRMPQFSPRKAPEGGLLGPATQTQINSSLWMDAVNHYSVVLMSELLRKRGNGIFFQRAHISISELFLKEMDNHTRRWCSGTNVLHAAFSLLDINCCFPRVLDVYNAIWWMPFSTRHHLVYRWCRTGVVDNTVTSQLEGSQ